LPPKLPGIETQAMQQHSMSAFRPHDFDTLAYSSTGLSLGRVSFAPSEFGDGAREPRDVMVKRVSDIVLALVFLISTGPIMLLIAAAIRLTSRGPALFRQQRIGLHGRAFVMLKFRTMRDAPVTPGSCPQATRHDPRVTRIGGWLRHTSCDELPQLLNVLAGTMSLVGPRPHAPGTCVGGRPFEAISHRYPDRHYAKPGMTGLAQIRGWRGETDTEEKLLRRLDSDLEYIATWSLAGDLRIICRTIATVLRMPNAY
jgi:lipopolysaccharide/colanic/teichoic acid biosynthesis glycosyltransferase